MYKSVKTPFTLTVRKDIISGPKVTFSGEKARVFAGKMLESTIIQNHGIRVEAANVLKALQVLAESGKELVNSTPGERERAAIKYEGCIEQCVTAMKLLKIQLRDTCYRGTNPPELVAQIFIIDEHLPTTLGKNQALGYLLQTAMQEGEVKQAGRWLLALQCGNKRLEALLGLLDGLTADSIWEIKALAEKHTTGVALHSAGIYRGQGKSKEK
jgi:hypothetical protein